MRHLISIVFLALVWQSDISANHCSTTMAAYTPEETLVTDGLRHGIVAIVQGRTELRITTSPSTCMELAIVGQSTNTALEPVTSCQAETLVFDTTGWADGIYLILVEENGYFKIYEIEIKRE